MRKFIVILGLVIGLIYNFNLQAYCSNNNDAARLQTISSIGTLANSHKNEEALAKCNEALKLYPEDVELYYWKATIEFNLEEYEQALKDYDKAIAMKPDASDIYVMRGMVKSVIGDRDGAMADYNHAIKLNPKDSSAYTMRACLKVDLGDLQGANDDLEISNKLFDEMEKQSKTTSH